MPTSIEKYVLVEADRTRRSSSSISASKGETPPTKPRRPTAASPAAPVGSTSSSSATRRSSAAGVVDQPLTLALWLRPRAAAGVLVHASVKPSGGDGWCVPFLGFDGTGRIVAQILYGLSATSFLTATGPGLKADEWSHVAMTWSPQSGVRLYVNGALAGVGAPTDATKRHYAAASGRPVYLTYGSDRASACWSGGHVEPPSLSRLGPACQVGRAAGAPGWVEISTPMQANKGTQHTDFKPIFNSPTLAHMVHEGGNVSPRLLSHCRRARRGDRAGRVHWRRLRPE
jgi:hypothetical protein